MANRTSCKTIQLCLNSNVYTALNNYYKDEYGTLESYLLAHLETVYNRRIRKDLRDFIAAANNFGRQRMLRSLVPWIILGITI